MKDPFFLICFSGTFIIVGLSFLFIGLYFIIRNSKKTKRCSKEVQGKITSNISYHVIGEGRDYYAKYQYEVNGRTIEAQQEFHGNKDYNEGEIVTIKYNPDNPEESYIKHDYSANFFGFGFFGIGLFSSLIGIIAIIISCI